MNTFDTTAFTVRLVGFSVPVIGSDPRRLVVLAIKVSQGKLHEKSYEYYLSDYSDKRVGEWISKAWGFPSVLEHVTFTFLIEGISRVCSHQLVRHRIASYTQESQRYSESYAKKAVEKAKELLKLKSVEVPEKNSEIIKKFLEVASNDEILEVALQAFVVPPNSSLETVKHYLESLARYYELVEKGMHIENARYILPQAIKTRIMVTMNLRELIHVACLRLSQKAQWEIREVVKKMVEEAMSIVPEINNLIEKMCVF